MWIIHRSQSFLNETGMHWPLVSTAVGLTDARDAADTDRRSFGGASLWIS